MLGNLQLSYASGVLHCSMTSFACLCSMLFLFDNKFVERDGLGMRQTLMQFANSCYACYVTDLQHLLSENFFGLQLMDTFQTL